MNLVKTISYFLPVAIVTSMIAVPAVAHATPNFPNVVREESGAAAAPSCQICHNGPQRIGTVTRLFGLAMRERGLVLYDEASLRSAFARMKTDKVDSDGDGMTDVQALAAGKDPNGEVVAGEIGDLTPRAYYGCAVGPGAITAGRRNPIIAFGGAAFLLLLSVIRTRRLVPKKG